MDEIIQRIHLLVDSIPLESLLYKLNEISERKWIKSDVERLKEKGKDVGLFDLIDLEKALNANIFSKPGYSAENITPSGSRNLAGRFAKKVDGGDLFLEKTRELLSKFFVDKELLKTNRKTGNRVPTKITDIIQRNRSNYTSFVAINKDPKRAILHIMNLEHKSVKEDKNLKSYFYFAPIIPYPYEVFSEGSVEDYLPKSKYKILIQEGKEVFCHPENKLIKGWPRILLTDEIIKDSEKTKTLVNDIAKVIMLTQFSNPESD